jgi:hypothetical protein
MILYYKFAEGTYSKDKDVSCDEAFKSAQDLIVSIAKEMKKGLWFTWLIWLLSRFYKKSVSKDTVSYNLFLIK